jgi:hypothetical protein
MGMGAPSSKALDFLSNNSYASGHPGKQKKKSAPVSSPSIVTYLTVLILM